MKMRIILFLGILFLIFSCDSKSSEIVVGDYFELEHHVNGSIRMGVDLIDTITSISLYEKDTLIYPKDMCMGCGVDKIWFFKATKKGVDTITFKQFYWSDSSLVLDTVYRHVIIVK